MFTSHTINSCKRVLHDYGEFNNFVDHMLTSMEEEISESDKVEQMDKEGYEIIMAIRSELESVYKELKIAIAARDDKKTMKSLTNTLDLLEKLEEEFEKVVEEGPGESLSYLGINYLYSTIKRIVSKTRRCKR
jgi:DNA repair exonuclease SbcCD ATPase subunit